MEHTPRRIVVNTFLYTGTLVVQKIIAFFYFWFLSSRLAPEFLGIYIWSLSLTTLFSIGVDLGLAPLLIREAARDTEKSERMLRSVLGLKIFFAFITIIALGAVLAISGRDYLTTTVVIIAIVVMIFDSLAMSFWSIMRAKQVVIYESIGMLVFHILVFALGAYLLSVSRSPTSAMIALAVGSFSIFIFSMLVVKFRFRMRISPLFDSAMFKFFVQLIPAFAAAGIFVRIYNAADSILLGYLIGNTAVGLYSVPAKVITALQMLLPGAFIASIYPAMSHYYKTSRQNLVRLFERSIGYLTILALPITAGLLILTPQILSVIWPEYLAVESTFKLMLLGLPFLFLSFPTGYLLNASDRQRKNTINRGIITVLNILLNLTLIPFLGVLGAGTAFLATNALLFFLDLRCVRQVIPVVWDWLLRITCKSAAATAIMVVLLIVFKDRFGLLTLVVAGMAVYFIVLLALRAFSREEINLLRDLFHKSRADSAVL